MIHQNSWSKNTSANVTNSFSKRPHNRCRSCASGKYLISLNQSYIYNKPQSSMRSNQILINIEMNINMSHRCRCTSTYNVTVTPLSLKTN